MKLLSPERLVEIERIASELLTTLKEHGQVPGFWAQATIDLLADRKALSTLLKSVEAEHERVNKWRGETLNTLE